MRVLPGALAMLLTVTSGCVFTGADDKPTYASDNVFTRPWSTCLVTNAEEKDDGTSEPWAIGQEIAEECAPDLLSAFRRETTEKDRRKAYALTADKAVAMVEANRRDRAEAALQGQAAASGSY